MKIIHFYANSLFQEGKISLIKCISGKSDNSVFAGFQEDQLGLSLLTVQQLESEEMQKKIESRVQVM